MGFIFTLDIYMTKHSISSENYQGNGCSCKNFWHCKIFVLYHSLNWPNIPYANNIMYIVGRKNSLVDQNDEG